MRFGSAIESNHRCRPLGYNVAAGRFEFTTAGQPLPVGAALAWSAIVGLAFLIIMLFGIGV